MERRSYHQYCGIAKALDLVGERWTLLIVRNLLLGGLRYSELLRGLPGITTNLLAKRLREMEELGLIERTRSSAEDGSNAYRLTPEGAGLEPVIHALGRWGWQWLESPKKGEYRSFEFLLVALRRRYRGGATLRAELIADGVPFRVLLAESEVEISRGEVTSPQLRLRGTGAALARLFLEPKTGSGMPNGIEVEGEAGALRVLLGAFARKEFEAGSK